jgi:hypothetical protein
MAKKSTIGLVILLLVIGLGFIVWQKSQVRVEPAVTAPPAESAIKKVDLTTQPEWVQKLEVSAKKGVSSNGLANFTLTINGLSDVESFTYIAQYQTSNKGTQGVLAMTPQKVTGTTFTKVIDLGTCSTKSCVRHDGVTSVDLELDFTTLAGDKATWTGTIDLK